MWRRGKEMFGQPEKFLERTFTREQVNEYAMEAVRNHKIYRTATSRLLHAVDQGSWLVQIFKTKAGNFFLLRWRSAPMVYGRAGGLWHFGGMVPSNREEILRILQAEHVEITNILKKELNL
jgi:hypothetical protein